MLCFEKFTYSKYYHWSLKSRNEILNWVVSSTKSWKTFILAREKYLGLLHSRVCNRKSTNWSACNPSRRYCTFIRFERMWRISLFKKKKTGFVILIRLTTKDFKNFCTSLTLRKFHSKNKETFYGGHTST